MYSKDTTTNTARCQGAGNDRKGYIEMSVLTITNENFEAEVMSAKEPVLVDFWATWCGPCRMLSPVVDKLAEEFEGKIKVGKINVDEQQELAARFGIMTIPTLLVFKGGEIVEKSVGVKPQGALAAMLNKHI